MLMMLSYDAKSFRDLEPVLLPLAVVVYVVVYGAFLILMGKVIAEVFAFIKKYQKRRAAKAQDIAHHSLTVEVD